MTFGDYLKSYKLKQASVIIPLGDKHHLFIYRYTHLHHTYMHIASTFSTILEFRTSERFRIREWLCNDDWPWSEKKKKKNPPKIKIKNISDQGGRVLLKFCLIIIIIIFFIVFREFIHLCKTENL